MPNALALCTTRAPMLPVPTTPSVLPSSSRPAANFFFSHFPPRVLCDASATCRARASGREKIDVVHAGAGAADHAQLRRRGEKVRGHLGGAADGERVVAGDDLAQLARLEADLEVDLRARDPLEDGLRFRREVVRDEDAHQRPPANECCAAASPAPSCTLAPRSCRPRSTAPITTSMSKSSK